MTVKRETFETLQTLKTLLAAGKISNPFNPSLHAACRSIYKSIIQ
jgi:hypothetical protein